MTISVFPGSVPDLGIQLDSPEWFEWLTAQSQFKYEGNLTTMSVKRRASNGKWYARKKVYSSDKGSIPVDLYIGGNEECTSEKLKEINYRFGQDWRDFWPWYHSPARKESKEKGVQTQEVYTEQTQPSQTSDEVEGLKARIIELEQLNSELQAANQSLQKAYDHEAEDAKRYYVLWRKYPDLERKNKRLQEQVDAFEAAPLKILDEWIEAAKIDLKPRTADKLRAYREYLLRSMGDAKRSSPK